MTDPTLVHPPPPAPDDRRTADRTECFLEVAVTHERKAFLAATVLDLSAGGVKLLVDPPPAPGDELRLTFLTSAGRLFQMPATVVHYIEHGDVYAVGCRFARELDDKEVAALL
jgi:hypothetical protein